jgi:hypothetical protein
MPKCDVCGQDFPEEELLLSTIDHKMKDELLIDLGYWIKDARLAMHIMTSFTSSRLR